MKLKQLYNDVIKDWKHWFGWIVSAGLISIAIVEVFKLNQGLNITFGTALFSILIPTLIVEIIADLIKHITEFQ